MNAQEEWGEDTPPLIRAIIDNDIASLQNELNHGTRANEFTPGDISALHYAAAEGNVEAVRLLLEHGANAKALDLPGFSPLHYAVRGRGGNPEIIQLLIEDGGVDVDIRKPGAGETALMHTSSSAAGLVGCAEKLLNHGAEVNGEDADGRTALYYAAEHGSDTIVKLLLERGADVHANEAQEQPFFDAVKGGNMNIVRTLLEAGSDIKMRNSWGETSLHHAAYGGSLEIVKYLIDAGVETNAKSKTDTTALHRAAEGGHEDIMQFLIESGFEINDPNTYGWTPLIFATKSCSIPAVRMLLDRGADASAAACGGWTPLHMASCSHTGDASTIIELLVKRGADIMARSWHHTHPGPAEEGESFQQRTHQHCDDTKVADRLITPLHCSVSFGHVPEAKLLLDLGADIEARDNFFMTPLHSAATHLHIPTIRLLLEKGANVNAVNDNGHTVLRVLLRALGKEQTQRLLAPYGNFNHLIDAEIAAVPDLLDRFNRKVPRRGRGQPLLEGFVA